jgi:hypothetical protein
MVEREQGAKQRGRVGQAQLELGRRVVPQVLQPADAVHQRQHALD